MPSGRLRTAGSAVALSSLLLCAVGPLGACTSGAETATPRPPSATGAGATASGLPTQAAGEGTSGTPTFLGATVATGIPAVPESPEIAEIPDRTGLPEVATAPGLPDPAMTTVTEDASCTTRVDLGSRAPVRPSQLWAQGGESGYEAARVAPRPGGVDPAACTAALPRTPDCELTFPWAGVGDDALTLATGARSLLTGRAYARLAESSDAVGGTASLLYTVLDFGSSPDLAAGAYGWYASAVQRCGVGGRGSIGGVSGLVGAGHRPTLLSTIPGRFLVTDDGVHVVVLVFEGGAWSDSSRATAARKVLPLVTAG